MQNEGDATASGVFAAEKRAERESEIVGQIDAIIGHDRADLARAVRRQGEDVGRGIVGRSARFCHVAVNAGRKDLAA